jgi:arsenite methyltransferase
MRGAEINKSLMWATGGGLLAIAAANRLAVDTWSTEDISGNTEKRFVQNATLADVAQRIEVRSEDVRELSYADQSFDVVVSMLCIHNIVDAVDREAALHQIMRALRPGGVALISDLAHTKEYARFLSKVDLRVQQSPIFWDTLPPHRVVEAREG